MNLAALMLLTIPAAVVQEKRSQSALPGLWFSRAAQAPHLQRIWAGKSQF